MAAAATFNRRRGVVNPNLTITLTLTLTLTSLTTEFVSNAATMGILGPVVAASASSSGRNAVNALLGSTFACSFSFALPTASGPNIVVYGTGQVRLLFLMRIGLAVEIGALMIGTLWVSYAVPLILGPATADYGAPDIEGINSYLAAIKARVAP